MKQPTARLKRAGSTLALALAGALLAAAPDPARTQPPLRIVDCTDVAEMSDLRALQGKTLPAPAGPSTGVRLDVVQLQVKTLSTQGSDACVHPVPQSSFVIFLRVLAQNDDPKLILFNATLRCGLFGTVPRVPSAPRDGKLDSVLFKFDFADLHKGERGLSLPFTGDLGEPNGGVTPGGQATTPYFVPHAHLNACAVAINV
jgi:hypothetical protein